jgi:lysophospholipase L1-like esterase
MVKVLEYVPGSRSGRHEPRHGRPRLFKVGQLPALGRAERMRFEHMLNIRTLLRHNAELSRPSAVPEPARVMGSFRPWDRFRPLNPLEIAMSHVTVRRRKGRLWQRGAGGAAVLLFSVLGLVLTGAGLAPAAAPTGVPAQNVPVFQDQTIREIVHTSVGGPALRIRISNEFGDQPLRIGEVHVALPADGTGQRIDPATDHELTFGGHDSATVPPGSPLLSDPVRMPVPARSNLVVSIYLPERTPATTVHSSAFQHNFEAAGDVAGDADIEPIATRDSWYFLSGVSVASTRPAGPSAVVALGDSITDGANTMVNANHRWPDLLSQRMGATHDLNDVGVLNAGIGGNRLLHDPNPPAGSPAEAFAAFFGPSALHRYQRDVAAQPGVRYVVVLIGINDIGHPGIDAPISETVTADDLIAGYRQLISEAHAQRLKIYGATMTPFAGDTLGFDSPEHEAVRQQVNHWIRTSGAYDGVIDFDKALRDPSNPLAMLPAYDSGDHLHPNDAGTAAMAQAVPLSFFH